MVDKQKILTNCTFGMTDLLALNAIVLETAETETDEDTQSPFLYTSVREKPRPGRDVRKYHPSKMTLIR